MNAHFVHANPKVRADSGKVALMKGPLVYCLEEIDNGENLSAIFVDPSAKITETYEEAPFSGSYCLTVKGYRISETNWDRDSLYQEVTPQFEEVTLKAIPYCYWGNRDKDKEMLVWIKERLIE